MTGFRLLHFLRQLHLLLQNCLYQDLINHQKIHYFVFELLIFTLNIFSPFTDLLIIFLYSFRYRFQINKVHKL